MEAAAEKRKSVRRTVSYPASIDLGDGSAPIVCTLCDASQEGAQLVVADPKNLPNEFILHLSSDGAARRRCRVVWRKETELGVRFLKDIRKASRPARAWVPPSVPDSNAAETRAEAVAADAEPPAKS